LTRHDAGGFDVVYCIGVLHHLKDARAGFEAVVRNVVPGGRFHCWVYAREGNAVVVHLVDPLRRIASRLPWWLTKYCIATPLAVPFFFYAKFLSLFGGASVLRNAPLFEYSRWIARREFGFFRHVAFDQLVTPQTAYFERATIEQWLQSASSVDVSTAYITMRNGNSWKFGARRKA
jgi:SAM-dependent methyltransferase